MVEQGIQGIGRGAARRLPSPAPLLVLPALAMVLAITAAPLAVLFRYSLDRFVPGQEVAAALTAENYVKFLADPYYRQVLWTTIGVAALSTAISLLAGFPVAYFLARTRSRWKSLLVMLAVLPLFVGNVARAAGWLAMLGTQGFVNELLVGLGLVAAPVEILYTPTAVVIGIVAVVLPYMILTLQGVLEGIDAALEEAAASLGANPASVFRRVLLPLALPGVAAGTGLVFILCMNAYATPRLLGGPKFHMMAVTVYDEMVGASNWPFGAALAFVLMIATLLLTVPATLALERRYRGGG